MFKNFGTKSQNLKHRLVFIFKIQNAILGRDPTYMICNEWIVGKIVDGHRIKPYNPRTHNYDKLWTKRHERILNSSL